MFYDKYKHLLGLPYVEGKDDCYGLVRKYYSDVYGISLRNWARPADAFHSGMDLLGGRLQDEGFQITEDSLDRLQVGDFLAITIGCRIANHCAVYVGNNMILHHLLDTPSREDNYSKSWKQRTLYVVRHPFVTEDNNNSKEVVDFLDLLPEHVKFRHGLISPVGR